jgi:hypothetical protein
MAKIVSAEAMTLSGLAAGTYGTFQVSGTNAGQFTLTAVGGVSGTAQLVTQPGGTVITTLNSPGTVSLGLLPGKYNIVLGGGTVPTNVALFRDGTGGHLEYPTQTAANAQVTELNNALQAGDTDVHIAVKAGPDLWFVNRTSKLKGVNPFAPVSKKTLQE